MIRGRCGVWCGVALFLAGSWSTHAEEASIRGVSPGAPEGTTEAAASCPTFSWSAVPGAEGYRLALFETLADGRVEPVFVQPIDGAALSWTPPRTRCPAPGRAYAWVIRAEREGSIVVGPWSEPLRFRVPGAPTVEELRSALEVLERWRAGGARSSVATEGGASRDASTGGSAEREAVAHAEASMATGTAAVRGEMPDLSGAAYGVFGIGHSPQGAGVVARNESSGADLILDGEAQGEADTLLRQSGIDRPSPSPQTFDIGNSGGGALTLTVGGVAVDTATTPIGWTRLTGVPAGFADGVDNDTTYSAGNQLQLAGTQFSVLEGPGSGLDADTLDGIHGAAYQLLVTGVCPAGHALQGIHPDGSVACAWFPYPPDLATVDDPANSVGAYASLAIGTDGFPVISYQDATAGTLKVAKCNDAACAGGDETITTVDDPANQVGYYTSIAIGTDGFPVVSYHDFTAGTLKVAKCNDAACAGGDETITTVDDPANFVGAFTSIAIGTDGFPVISYLDAFAASLKVAKCNDAACAGQDETITTVDDPANFVGGYTSIAIGVEGFPVISYQDASAGTLKVAKCNDAACAGSDETKTTVDDPANQVGVWTSIAIGAGGFPVVSYQDATAGTLKVAKCNDAACAGGDETITTVDDPASSVGGYSSIAIGADGFPVISYQDATSGTLKVAKCNDAACSGWNETITTVNDPANQVGYYTSIAIGADGFPVIGHLDASASSLRVTKCHNPGCVF